MPAAREALSRSPIRFFRRSLAQAPKAAPITVCRRKSLPTYPCRCGAANSTRHPVPMLAGISEGLSPRSFSGSRC